MRMSARLTLAVVAFAFGAAATDPQAEARVRFREGLRLFAQDDPANARAAFEDAYRILPNARVLANIADCYAAEDRPVEAVRTYRRFLHEGGNDVPEDARREAEEEMVRLRERVGDLVLAVEPAGAEVVVDGTSMGAAPLPWPVAVVPGAHVVEVRADGYAPFSESVGVSAGDARELVVELRPPGDEEPEPESGPGPAGPPEPTPLGRGPLLWTGIGLTAALAIGATVTGLLALRQSNEYENPDTSIARRRKLFDSIGRLGLVTDILLDAAVVVGLGTAALYLFAGPSEEDPDVAASAPVRLRIAKGGPRCDLAWSF